MGKLGALAGLGRGLQGYATTLQEQQKMDWQSQRDAVAFERQKNLEALRNSNENTRLDTKLEAERGMFQDKQKYDIERDRVAEETYQTRLEGEREYTLEQKKLDAKTRRVDLASEIAAKSKANIDSTRAAFELTKDMEVIERTKRVDELKTSEFFLSMPESKQKTVLFAAMHPESAKILSALNKIDKFDTEEYSNAYQKGLDRWDAISDSEKEPILQEAAVLGFESPAELRDYYATTQAQRSTGMERMVKDGPSDLGGKKGSVLKVEALKDLVKNPSKITDEILERVSDPDQKIKLEEAKAGKVPVRDRVVATPVQRNTMMSPPTGPEREGPSLGSMFMNKLGGALEGLRNK